MHSLQVLKTNNTKVQHKRNRITTGRSEPVAYSQAWPRIWSSNDQETNSASGQNDIHSQEYNVLWTPCQFLSINQACCKHLCPSWAMHVKNAVIWSTWLVLIYLYCLLANHNASFFSFPCFRTAFTTNWIAVSQSDSRIFSSTLLRDKQSLKKFHNTK